MPSTKTIASAFSVGQRCCGYVSVGRMGTSWTRVIIVTRASVSVAIGFVVVIVPPIVVTVAVFRISIRLISIPFLVTDTIFQRIYFALECR